MVERRAVLPARRPLGPRIAVGFAVVGAVVAGVVGAPGGFIMVALAAYAGGVAAPWGTGALGGAASSREFGLRRREGRG